MYGGASCCILGLIYKAFALNLRTVRSQVRFAQTSQHGEEASELGLHSEGAEEQEADLKPRRWRLLIAESHRWGAN